MDEAAQKHGAERLDFAAFLARFFPGRRRHDFEAITAYVAYRNEFEASAPATR
jgi:hypothetical protein